MRCLYFALWIRAYILGSFNTRTPSLLALRPDRSSTFSYLVATCIPPFYPYLPSGPSLALSHNFSRALLSMFSLHGMAPSNFPRAAYKL